MTGKPAAATLGQQADEDMTLESASPSGHRSQNDNGLLPGLLGGVEVGEGAPTPSVLRGVDEEPDPSRPRDSSPSLPPLTTDVSLNSKLARLLTEIDGVRVTQDLQHKMLQSQQKMLQQLSGGSFSATNSPYPRRRMSASTPPSTEPSARAAESGRQDQDDDVEDGDGDEEVEDYTTLTNAALWRQASDAGAGVLHPEKTFRVSWDLFMLVLLFYVAIAVPLTTFFDIKQTTMHVVWDFMVDLLFLCDIVLNFRTGYFDKAKVLELDRKLIRTRYLRSWFLFDLVSSVPVQMLVLIDRDTFEQAIFLKLIRLLKLGRLSRVNRIKMIRDLSYNGVIRPGVVPLIRLLIFYFFVTHMVACLYWAIAKASPVPCVTGDLQGWDGVLDAGGQFPWGICEERLTEPWTRQYVLAFYWSLIVMMGNESYPIKPEDKVFSTCVILVGMLVNSVVIGSCASLLANMDQTAVQKQQQFDSINENLNYHKVSSELATRIRSYYDYLWACGHHTNEDALFRDLPEKIRMQLSMNKKKPLIRGVEIFQNVTPQCTVSIVEALVPVIMLPREYVMVQGQPGDEMFFINRGFVQVTQFINFQEAPIRQLTDGGHFGEIALLNANGRRTANVVTISFCDLQMLDRKSFSRIQKEHDEFREQVKAYSDARAKTMAASRSKQMVNTQKSKSRLALEAVKQKSLRRLGSISKVVPTSTPMGKRRSSNTGVACDWTNEAAAKQAIRKNADEVFAEAAMCINNTKKAAASLDRRRAAASRRAASEGYDDCSAPFKVTDDGPGGGASGPKIRYIPGCGAQAVCASVRGDDDDY
eukprot:Transcript_19010.p1 GENE.Transcript_19010~~Transcript_19010.p1  ORF type:complete len:813 (-),score=358.41 Transcript_19010:1119-3557(-)